MTQDNAHAPKTSVPPNELGTALRNGRLLALIFVCLTIVFVYGYIQRAQTAAAVQEEIQQKQAMISSANLRTAELEAELSYVSSEDFLDKIAREELGLAKPGETALVLLDAATRNESMTPADDLSMNGISSEDLSATAAAAPIVQSPQQSNPAQTTSSQSPARESSSSTIWQAWLDLFTSPQR